MEMLTMRPPALTANSTASRLLPLLRSSRRANSKLFGSRVLNLKRKTYCEKMCQFMLMPLLHLEMR